MTLDQLRQTGKDGWYDPDTDQYYLVGEGPVAKETPKSIKAPNPPLEPTGNADITSGDTGSVTGGDASDTKGKDKKGGK